MDETEAQKQRMENWRTQLKELNARSRWYTTQLWQVPLAFVGIVGVTVSKLPEQEHHKAVFLLLVILGVAVFVHMLHLMKRLEAAVLALQRMEAKLGLEDQATLTGWGVAPFILVVVIMTTYLVIAVLE